MYTAKEKEVLRELARQYRALAELPVNAERQERMRKVNDLHTGLRPGVWIQDLPWHELNVNNELACVCEDPFAREMETYFRRSLFSWKYFQADMVLPLRYTIPKAFSHSGNGMTIEEDALISDEESTVYSHGYHDKLETEEQLAQMKTPVLTAYPERDAENAAMGEDILHEILPVRLGGPQIVYSAWDEISALRGVEPILFDIMDRPEFLHKIVQKLSDNQAAVMQQMEDLNLLENDLDEMHCTPAYSDDLPKPDKDGKIRQKNVWFRSMAQVFAVVSPEMHEEFEMQYMKPLMERCGLVYYGCCEPLDNKIHLLKKIRNMRKIGVSPWAKVEASAEQIGSDYVVARKPNPALVAAEFDADAVRREIRETAEACLKYNCPYEYVLKDVSTVSRKLSNLVEWNSVVKETLDEYY